MSGVRLRGDLGAERAPGTVTSQRRSAHSARRVRRCRPCAPTCAPSWFSVHCPTPSALVPAPGTSKASFQRSDHTSQRPLDLEATSAAPISIPYPLAMRASLAAGPQRPCSTGQPRFSQQRRPFGPPAFGAAAASTPSPQIQRRSRVAAQAGVHAGRARCAARGPPAAVAPAVASAPPAARALHAPTPPRRPSPRPQQPAMA